MVVTLKRKQMDEFEAQRQIYQSYQNGKIDGMSEKNELLILLKQFIIDDIDRWTEETWEKFDKYMGTYDV